MKSKTFKGFGQVIILMIVGGIFGFFTSKSVYGNESSLEATLYAIQDFIVDNVYAIYFVILIISIILTLIFYYRGKKHLQESLDDEEGEINENILSAAIYIPNIGFYLLMALFAALLKNLAKYEYGNIELMLITLTTFIAYTLFFVVMQKKIVENLKELYPEKRGNAFQINFQREWEGSLDEREKVALYHTGYKTYRFLDKALLVILVITAIMSDMHGTNLGIYPPMVIGLLLVLSNIVYLYYSIKSKNIV